MRDADLPTSTHHHPAAAQCGGNASGLDHTLRRNSGWWRIAFHPPNHSSATPSKLHATCKKHLRERPASGMDQVRMPPDAALGRRGAPHSPTVDCNRGLLTEETMTAHVAAVAPIATAKPSSVRWKIFLLMLFLISINYIDRASLSVAMPLIAK